jgi:hypothetical protein
MLRGGKASAMKAEKEARFEKTKMRMILLMRDVSLRKLNPVQN